MTLKILYRILFLIVIFISPALQADAFDDIAKRLDTLVKKSKLKKEDLGIWVANSDGKEIYTLNSQQQFIPASLSKIFTAYAVLDSWNSATQFSTEVLVKPEEIKGVTLKGDIYLRGGGDPAFVSEKMWYLVNELYRQDIRVIEGNVVVDESRFDSVRFDKGRLPQNQGRAYDAPVGALSFNWNSVNVFYKPGDKVGDPVSVHIDPPNTYILEVENKARTVRSGSNKISIVRVPVTQNKKVIGDKIVITGTVPIGLKESVAYRAISEPDLWTGANFIEFLSQRGITVKGKVVRAKTPKSAEVLAVNPGTPLRLMVADMMKFSNNFVAEMLAKNLAVENGHAIGTLSGGVEVIKKAIEGAGVSQKEYKFVSPSGLSRENLVAPKHFGSVLMAATHNFNLYPEFLSSFPIGGVDGTLKGRLKGSLIRAKTGLLDGVAGLAGYAYRPDANWVAFSFIYNGSQHGRARHVLDQLAKALVDK